MKHIKDKQLCENAHKVLCTRLFLIGLLILGLIAASGCIKRFQEMENVTATPISTPIPSPISTTTSSLSNVKVAIVYERLNDARPKRTIEDQLKILKETNPDMIFRASWRWNILPNSCSEVEPSLEKTCIDSGYSFDQMKNTIGDIKKQNPNIIIVGSIPAQKINEKEVNEITGETIDDAQTSQMALDPAKWGITSTTKDEIQKGLQKKYVASGRYPDISNPKYQELFLSWAKRQIDSGMDAIWIDLLFTQADTMRGITKDVNHPAVRDSYMGASHIIDEIHKYGESKGKHIYVGTWSYDGFSKYPYAPPKLDFVTESPTQKEVLYKKFDDAAWNIRKANIEAKLGNIPIFIFIDWADDNGQLAIFSQKLSKEQQRDVLKMADDFFESKGMKFIYPVHGGSTGHSATALTYGKYTWYDSLAPEFETYDTIKQLAQDKSKR